MPSIQVNGMHCEHCRKAVTEALSALSGVQNVQVDLLSKQVRWDDADAAHPVALQAIKKAISDIGFEPVDK